MQGTQYATERSILCRGAFCGSPMHPLFNPEADFHFLNINFKLSALYELLRRSATLSTFFTLYRVYNAF